MQADPDRQDVTSWTCNTINIHLCFHNDPLLLLISCRPHAADSCLHQMLSSGPLGLEVDTHWAGSKLGLGLIRLPGLTFVYGVDEA